MQQDLQNINYKCFKISNHLTINTIFVRKSAEIIYEKRKEVIGRS